MKFSSTKSNNIVIIRIEGKLDANTSEEFQRNMTGLLTKGEKKFAIDCSELEFVSSAGIRAFLWIAKELQKLEGSLSISSLNDNVSRVFNITNLRSVFPIYNSTDEAIKKMT